MTPADIQRALHAPAAFLVNWPKIEAALDELHVSSELAKVAALATVSVECPTWEPKTEKYNGDPTVYFQRYDGRLGNNQPGDGFFFRGRGFIQITGRANYRQYGKLLGVDLESNPGLALDVNVAACIFAAFFYVRKVAEAADRRDWKAVRRLVNGGTNNLAAFLQDVTALTQLSNT